MEGRLARRREGHAAGHAHGAGTPWPAAGRGGAGGPDAAGAEEQAAPFGLAIRERARGARHVICLRGEADIVTAAAIERKTLQLCGAGAREIVIDLRALSFIDGRGLSALLACKGHCERCRVAFALIPGGGATRRLLELAELRGTLPLIEPGAA